NPLPGPLPLPFVGNLIFYSNDLIVAFSKLQTKYGDFFEFYKANKRYICLLNEDLVKVIMKPAINSNFHFRSDENNGLRELGRHEYGISFNADYNKWRYYRKFFSQTLLTPSFSRQALICAQAGFEEMSRYWDLLGEEAIIDFPEWMKRYFMEIIVVTTSSKPAHALSNFYKRLSNKKMDSVANETEEFMEAVQHLNEITY
ncbi:2966_t:CDS:1, partial [Acaulospora colombiana]